MVRAKLVKIGNSRGIRLAKPLLEVAGLADEVDIQYATGGHPYPFRGGCRFDDKEGHVVADQLRAVDGDRLIKHLGVFDEDTLVKVLSVLQAMFAV